MQNEESVFPQQGKKQTKSCCLMSLVTILVCLLIIMTGIVCILISDFINLRNEDHTLSWYASRYKVACQFLWFDLKDWASRKNPSETQIISCPADTPESEPESKTEQEPEAEP